MSMRTSFINRRLWQHLIVSMLLTGCASTAVTKSTTNDPWRSLNKGTQSFNDEVDKRVLKPLAKGYQRVTSDTINQGVSNVFNNINDIGVTINDFLQLKLTQGGMDAGRFLINSTAGVGGMFDVANTVNLPKHNEDFGQTLGVWGVPTGPYLVLPFLGPSSPRETVGHVGDALLNPLTYVSFFGGTAANVATAGSRAVNVVDTRADIMTNEKIANEATIDRYEFMKNSYQQHREYLLHDGNMPESDELSLDEDTFIDETKTKSKTDTSNTQLDNVTKTDTAGSPPVVNHPKHLLNLTLPEDK